MITIGLKKKIFKKTRWEWSSEFQIMRVWMIYISKSWSHGFDRWQVAGFCHHRFSIGGQQPLWAKRNFYCTWPERSKPRIKNNPGEFIPIWVLNTLFFLFFPLNSSPGPTLSLLFFLQPTHDLHSYSLCPWLCTFHLNHFVLWPLLPPSLHYLVIRKLESQS